MYLTIKQHDMFRTLLMGFEIPFRAYIADIIVSNYGEDAFESLMESKKHTLSHTSPQFLKKELPSACTKHTLKKAYAKFQTAKTSVEEIVVDDIDLPMVGALNLVTFALTENFGSLYSLFGSYNAYCDLAEKYRYARNKLNHPGCRTLEDVHLVPVLSFVKDICHFMDEKYFLQKTKEQLLTEIKALQQRKIAIPVKKHNFFDMPYGEARIVCRDDEIQRIKNFVYGNPDDLRKQHSLCIYGYGGVGKTALVLEALKQIVRDIQDQTTINEYQPQYILFFSAKKRKLAIAAETGKLIEQQTKHHFETADELISLILTELCVSNLKKFREDGLIVIDNLETLSIEERQKIKHFVETKTPSEMQFLLTSRNSEEYETNFKLGGFNFEAGKSFIENYNNENALEITLNEAEEEQLISFSKGNTLVLVLSLKRLSGKLATIKSLDLEFSSTNAWHSLRSTIVNTPSNTFEVVAEFMYKDTFEHIEKVFCKNIDLFYKVLKVFAVIQNGSTDVNTICLLTNEAYPRVEEVIDILCNFLIIEKKDTQYYLNDFAEKYIVGRFLPDAETYNKLSTEISSRQRNVQSSLKKLEEDMKYHSSLASIMRDWLIISDIDRITAAKMHQMYGDVKQTCDRAGRFLVEGAVEDLIKTAKEAEMVTAHPYIKYQKARILQLVDNSKILDQKHTAEIKRAFSDAIFAIKTIEHYSPIQQTKSYASLLWLFGQYLADCKDYVNAMRYLEESKISFEEQKIMQQEYYQCAAKLGTLYLDYYIEDKSARIVYLRKARSIEKNLSAVWNSLGKARTFVGQLKARLQSYGQY